MGKVMSVGSICRSSTMHNVMLPLTRAMTPEAISWSVRVLRRLRYMALVEATSRIASEGSSGERGLSGIEGEPKQSLSSDGVH